MKILFVVIVLILSGVLEDIMLSLEGYFNKVISNETIATAIIIILSMLICAFFIYLQCKLGIIAVDE